MAQRSNFQGEHDEADGLASLFNATGAGRAESMDVVNDPRFFQDNVLNYRLAAFGGLSVVSGLMVQNAMSQLFDMDKNMQVFTANNRIYHPNGLLQLLSFLILILVLGMNMLATYVGVAQPYHTIRLMTAGPTGFDTAAAYYLNRNIVTFRHAAVKAMLLSLPLYILQMGIRLVVKFDRATEKGAALPAKTPGDSRIQGIIFCAVMTLMAIGLYWIHAKHFAIFKDRYNQLSNSITGSDFTNYMRSMMTPAKRGSFLDV